MNNKKAKSIAIFAICYIAYVSIYVARLNLSMSSPVLIGTEIITKNQIGILGSVFSIIYAAGRLICGNISDREPPYVMICSGLILTSAANLGFGFFPPFFGMLILWSLNALAQSMLWSSILCVITALHGETRAKKLNSYMVTSVAVGNIAGIIVNTRIITTLGVRFAFLIPGGITLVMGAVAFAALRRIDVKSSMTVENVPINDNKMTDMRTLLSRRELLIALLPAFLHGMIKDNISLWMTIYFTDSFEIDLESSANFVLFIPIVGFAGRMIYPLLYKLCKEREHLVSVIGFSVCLAAAIPLIIGSESPVCAMLALGSIYAAVSVINTSFLSIYPIHFASDRRVASVSGMMDFVTYLGAGISSVVYGNVGYSVMFISWAAVSAVSILLLSHLMKRTEQT